MLGIPVDASFPGWTEFKMASGSRFAIGHTSYPQSVVEKQSIVLSFAVDDIHKAVKDLSAAARDGASNGGDRRGQELTLLPV
jgi:hypothetical protein